MNKSPVLGLTLTRSEDSDKKFLTFRTELAGDDDSSNMMILDRVIGDLDNKVNGLKAIEYTEQSLTETQKARARANIDAASPNELDKTVEDAVEAALESAKKSGEFDGEDGMSPTVSMRKENGVATISITDVNGVHTVTIEDGTDGTDGGGNGGTGEAGEDGGYYVPSVSQSDSMTATFAFTPSKSGMEPVTPVTITLPQSTDGSGDTGTSGTTDHSQLINRNMANQHNMSAITGLESALNGKQPVGDYVTEDELAGMSDALRIIRNLLQDATFKTDVEDALAELDEVLGIGSEKKWSITYTLDNVEVSNTDDYVDHGSPYSTEIHASARYSFDYSSVIVMMGADDITDSVVSDNGYGDGVVIDIPSVTSEVHIEAAAYSMS